MSIKRLNNKGIGLVEVIAALGITLMTITALVSLALYTMRTSLQSKLTLEGSKMATREMELVRAYRDRSPTWNDFITTLSSSNCEVDSGPGICHMETDIATLAPVSGTFVETVDNQAVTRSFSADLDPEGTGDNNVVYITVTVSWSIAGRTHQTNLYTYLTNWRND
jgi:Tfp pilus assembly protein PilV